MLRGSKVQGAVAGVALLLGALACGGLGGRATDVVPPEEGTTRAERDDEVGEAMQQLGGTRLDDAPASIGSSSFEGGGGASFDVGSGIQVLQAAPVGENRRAVQASVVFDRPVVPLSDLDSMAQTAPLSCTPEVGAKARWAGTATAVLVPEGGAFPPSTAFSCTVAAGLKAIDGSTLEKPLTFAFETPRLHVLGTTPNDGAEQVRPEDPIELAFDQEVDPAAIRGHLSLRTGAGKAVVITSVEAGTTEQRVVLKAALAKGTSYALELGPGATSTRGPLPTTEPWSMSFETYPPLEVRSATSGAHSANAWIELQFTTSVPNEAVTRHLTVDPRPAGWDPSTDSWPSQYWSYGIALEPRTTYTFTLSADLEDEHGQRLGEAYTWTVDAKDYDPSGSFPTGFHIYPAKNPPELPFKHLNLSEVDLRGAPFSPSMMTSPEDWDELVGKAVAAGGRPGNVEVDPTPNHTELDRWPFRDLLSPGGFGWVASRVTAPELTDWQGRLREFDGLWVVTDLGGTVKMAHRSTEVWVTSLSEGAPVEGVEVLLHRGSATLATGRTDAQGLARLPVGTPGSGWERKDVWVELKKGEDDSVVVSRWGPEGWNWVNDDGFAVRSEAWLDRGVYRLGDPVYAHALFRRADETGLVIPSGSVTWRLADPEGAEVASGEGVLDARAGFSLKTALPGSGSLGDYLLEISASGEGWSREESMSVAARAYRPPAFRVHVSAPEIGVAGEPVRATLDARYLFGAEMTKGKVSWRAWTEERSFSPEGWDGWSFGEEPRGWWEDEPAHASRDLPNLVGALGKDTSWSVTLDPGTLSHPEALFLEAEVTDVDRQVIANFAETLVHPGEIYAGVRAASSLPKAGEGTTVEVVALGTDGAVRSGTEVGLTLVKRTMDSVREKGMDGQWRWVNTSTDEPVSSTSLRSAAEPVTWTVTPQETGRHVLIAKVKDTAGREVVTESSVWVVGKGVAAWGRRDDGRMGLVLEKEEVAPGETARVLVQAPLPDLWALVTVERETVLWRKVVKLEGTAPTIEIPTTDAWLPEVSVSVIAVTGAGPQDAPDKGRPEAFFGRVELGLDSAREHLAVEVEPSAEVYRPRDKVEVEVKVTKAGAPAAGAGVVLYAVDEAILSLTKYPTPDPYPAMYGPHGLSVATADARYQVLDRAPYLTKGAKIGGGGADPGATGPEVRSRFVTTVTWQTDLVTGPDGKVKASFELPDNLTAFRIMAVADHGATAFGSAQEEIRVSRPLVVRPALPRLLREGDEAFAGVVVHNDTDSSRWVEVSAVVDGPIEVRGSPFGLDVPARASVEVPFHLKALEAGHATFTFRADSEDDHDGVEVGLDVGRDVLIETTATAGLADGEWTEQIARPDDARPGFGGLRVDVATTALVGTTDGLSYLLDYPYGCAEQRTARGLGALALLSVYDKSGTTLPRDVLEQRVRETIEVLPRFRVGWPGGYSYWSGDLDPSVMATVYVVEFLARAKGAGFEVPDKQLQSGVAFLREAEHSPQRWFRGWDEDSRTAAEAHIVFALGLAGEGDAGLVSRVWERRARLPVFALARLQEGIALSSGPDARTAEIGRIVMSRSTIEASSASVKETESGRWARLWASDDLATAAALEAAVASGGSPLAPKYALHLASSRKTGHWANTRATATALFALARYADTYETHAEAVKVAVTLAGKELLSESIPVPGSARRELAMGEVANGPLVVTTDDPAYWFARLQYAPQVPKPRDEGIGVQRHLEILEGAGEGNQVVAGATVRVTLTVVSPVARHFVAVRDPLPAGFEPVDTSLATASRHATTETYEEPDYDDELEDEFSETPDYGGSQAFDHTEIDDGEVRLFATYLPPGVHTFRYLARATSPGTYHHPPMRAEEMYEPEVFGQTKGGTMVIGE